MSRNPSVSLTDHHQKFIAELVASGRYHGVSEVIRDGLRLLEQKEARQRAYIERLERAVDEAIASGPPEPMEPMSEIIAAAERGKN